ncbi:MAG: hypothetical protein DCC55_31015 [Chloroflexi bacterium]|nr:MAG: hypothetical protein DCC55_31015 [Chloroflexota bacterium]
MSRKTTPSPNHDQLYQTAEAQAGYFTAAQARRVGFSHALLSYHVQTGLFERVHPGIYRLRRFPASAHEDLFVAWLRAGPHSVISHDSALALYELSDLLPDAIHVTAPRTASRRHSGLRLHTNRLEPGDVTHYACLQRCRPHPTVGLSRCAEWSMKLAFPGVKSAMQWQPPSNL